LIDLHQLIIIEQVPLVEVVDDDEVECRELDEVVVEVEQMVVL